MRKKQYTREEKIGYYTALKNKAEERLKYLESPDYQEWDGKLAKELREKRQAESIAKELLKYILPSKV